MKKYKPNLIAEIGLNHLGDKKILNKYKSILSKIKIDGITIQLLKKSFFQKINLKNFILMKILIINFLDFVPKNLNL